MRIAVVQFAAAADKAANLTAVTALINRAADGGAALVVAPEASMLDFGRPDELIGGRAESLDGRFVTGLAELARHRGITVVAGMFERTDEPGRVFNTVVTLGADGSLLGVYRKQHLFDALGWKESDKLVAGEPGQRLVFDCGDLRVGVMTCYDLRFPELARALVDDGATALAVPSAWVAGPHKVEQWQVLTTARAIENVCYVAASDQHGPTYAGHARIVDPLGVELASCGGDAGIGSADVAAETVAACRERMPSLTHRRWKVAPR